VPRLGGVAVVTSAAVALTLTLVVTPATSLPAIWPALQPFVLGGLLIFLAGVVDDIRGLGPAVKLVAEFAAAGVVMSSGLLIERVTILDSTWTLHWLAYPITAGWIVGVTNAFNLIDGVDGLAPGIGALAGAACGAILIVRGHAPEAMLLAAFVGAMLGFLVYNFEPASIFLGDSGSLVTGFLLATTAIAGWQKGATALASAVPLLIFALPIADAASTLVRRVLARPTEGRTMRSIVHRIVEPDREHIHHRLLAMGWSVRYTVIVLYGVTALLSILALATAQVDR
jgi:UDP-GlcNAc:undecaprenyl-phosphate GlcNAc-1-phosphate transferase